MFNKAYFDKIWPDQGLHRHDYCESLASTLVSKYGKVRILDIGTGCGYLVNRLRELGCSAWGIDISDYATENNCAPGYILKAGVSDIPFKDNFFDLVFSQGLWCHIPEEDIAGAWLECLRVGNQQLHHIDYEEAPEDIPYFRTRKPESWWDQKLQVPKVLVACPTHELKEYAMPAWIEAVNSLDYPNFDILVVDNSPTPGLYNRWKDKIPMIYLPDQDQSEIASARINASMEVIKKRFLEGDYTWWFNLEIDVIPPPEILNLLTKFPSDWTSHDYRVRLGINRMTGIGCSLLSRDIAKASNFTSNVHGPDSVLWTDTQNTHKTLTLTNWLEIKHIDKEEINVK